MKKYRLLLLLMLIVILSGCFKKADVLTVYVSETISAIEHATTIGETSTAPPSLPEYSVKPEQETSLYELVLTESNIGNLSYYPSPDGKNTIIVSEEVYEDKRDIFYLNDFGMKLCTCYKEYWAEVVPCWINNTQVLLGGELIFDIGAKTVRVLGCGTENKSTAEDLERFAKFYNINSINKEYALIGSVEFFYGNDSDGFADSQIRSVYPLANGNGFVNCQTIAGVGTVFNYVDFATNQIERICLAEYDAAAGMTVFSAVKSDEEKAYFYYSAPVDTDNDTLNSNFYCEYDLRTGELTQKKLKYDYVWELGDNHFLIQYADYYYVDTELYDYVGENCYRYFLYNAVTDEIKKEIIIDDNLVEEYIFAQRQPRAFLYENELYYVDGNTGELICYNFVENSSYEIEDNKLILPDGKAAFKTSDGWRFDAYEEDGQYYVRTAVLLDDDNIDEWCLYDKYQLVLEGENQ